VPFVATAWRSPRDPLGEFPAEFEAPLPDRLVRHRVPTTIASNMSPPLHDLIKRLLDEHVAREALPGLPTLSLGEIGYLLVFQMSCSSFH
jgi:hypothetical protein